MSFLRELSHMLGQQNAFQQIVIFVTLNIRLNQANIIKICSDCSDIVGRYIIHKCPLGHKLQ